MASPADVVVIGKVVPTRVDVDAVTGVPELDHRSRGFSLADHAALAVGSTLAAHHGVAVRVVTVGADEDAAVLATFAACVDAPASLLVAAPDAAASARLASATVADLIARHVSSESLIVAGDHSLDRGSGSVPARVAERLGLPQALGLMLVDATTGEALRRLSGGRRERIRLPRCGVISVEASAARAPRATPLALLTPRVTRQDVGAAIGPSPRYAPYRVPAAHVAAPTEPVAARRAMEVIGALTPTRVREVLVANPSDAAAAILDRLHAWGYR